MTKSALAFLALCALVIAVPAATEETGPELRLPRVEVKKTSACPVEILPRKSRVVDPEALLDRGDNLAAQEWYKRKLFGATERQVVYDVVFRNTSEHDLLAVAFVWTARDEDDGLVFRRMSHYAGTPVPPGRVQVLHDLDVMIPGGVARYELSVLKTEFADGSSCEVRLDG